MKKFFSIMLSVFLVTALLAGCGGGASSAPASSAPADNNASSVASTPATSGTGTGLKIAIVSSPSGVDDGSFNQDNYNGILDFIKTHPDASVKAIQETNMANSVAAVEAIMADYDVIVTPGYQFAGIYALATANPEKKFILVDTFPSENEKEVSADNIYAMQFAEQESGFFAGVAAALDTKSGKVAVVNGIAFPSNVNYQFGFESGVAYANKHLGTKAEVVSLPSYAGTDRDGADVGGNYVGDFNDPTTGKVVGEALLAEGVDIILVAAGNSGNGVITAVKENGKAMVIGCDVDQYDDGVNGDKNIILTSVLKNMRINVERQLNAIADGSFKGENVTLHADTDSTGYVMEPGRQQLSEAALKALADVYALVKDGTIVPASNFNGHTVDNFPGL